MRPFAVRHFAVLVAAGFAAAVLAGCSPAGPVQVSASGIPPAAPAPPAPVTSFQGAVTAIDVTAGALVVDVSIVWAPVIAAGDGARRVLVDAGTHWEPAPLAIAGLRVGDEVQVDAAAPVEGVWTAQQIQLFDID